MFQKNLRTISKRKNRHSLVQPFDGMKMQLPFSFFFSSCAAKQTYSPRSISDLREATGGADNMWELCFLRHDRF